MPLLLNDFSKAAISLLTTAEENTFKLELAHDIVKSREAELHFIRSLLNEAHASLGCRKAEMQLAAVREIEAKRRVEYYSRMGEVASNNLVDAEMEVGVIRRSMWIASQKSGNPEDYDQRVVRRVEGTRLYLLHRLHFFMYLQTKYTRQLSPQSVWIEHNPTQFKFGLNAIAIPRNL